MPLTQEFQEEMKEKLLTEKMRLEGGLSRFAKATDTEGNYETVFQEMGTDPDENASEVEQYVDDIALEGNLEAQLKDIEDALLKIEEGRYGICETTGEEIGEERLRVYPQARTAILRS